MSEVLQAVITGLVATVIWEISKGYYLSWRGSRPTRIFWDFLNADATIIISAHLRKVTGVHTPFVPLGDLLGYATITRYFYQKVWRGVFRRKTFQLLGSEEHWEDQKGNNLVIIGGPFYNKAAQVILVEMYKRLTGESKSQIPHLVGFWKGRFYNPDDLEPTYTGEAIFQVDLARFQGLGDEVITTKDRRHTHSPELKLDPDTLRYTGCDYGLLIKCRNFYTYDKTIVIIYGAHHYGTYGAARFATNNKLLKNLGGFLHAAKSQNDGLWALVECIVSEGNITDVELKDKGMLYFTSN